MVQASQGHDPRMERREHHLIRASNTFKLAAARFIETEMRPKVKNWKTVESVLRLHCSSWADKPIQDLRRRDCHALLDALVDNGQVAMAREVRKHLHRFWGWAVDRELVSSNPMTGLKRGDLAVTEEAGRALRDDEIKLIWSATETMSYPYGPLFRLLLLTGCRRTEWAAASRSEINSDKQWFELPKSRDKSKRGNIVPLSNTAWAIVQGLPVWTGNDYYLFSHRGGAVPVTSFTRAKEALDKATGITEYFRPSHDYRVTCETRLASLGFNQEVRDAVLNHARPGLQKTYNKFDYLAQKQQALQAYADHIASITKCSSLTPTT